ncbi:MAG: replicative DNA helicase, partial [Clostridia bacterium]|nr:replicative DNA helicase [Clostridia bacterium]
MNGDFTRKMPVAIEAEQSVLGSILINPESFDKIAGLMTSDDFYLEEHKNIFETMKELYKKNKEIDVVTLIDALVRDGVYDKAGGTEYIKIIAKTVPTASNIVDYAKIVKDKSTLRSLINACDDISSEAYTEAGEVEHMLDAAEQRIFAIAERRESKNFEKISDVLTRVYSHLELISKDKSALKGTSTGFSGIDRVLVGMGDSDLVLVGARPGMGKTSFCLN